MLVWGDFRYVAPMDQLWNTVWESPRPFVHPLVAPNGGVLTVQAPGDHPWHHGLWFAIKFVNDENFWEEYGDFGVLRVNHVEVQHDAALGGRREIADISWVRPNSNEVVITETRVVTEVALADDAYALDWHVTLTPSTDVTFDRTPFTTWGGYGGLTLRGAPDFTDTLLTTPAGHCERVLGDRSPWCAIDGMATTAAGDVVPAGVVMIDHPENVSFPTPWYASTRAATYGEGWANFFNAAFLWDGPTEVAANTPFVHRHRVVVHSERWEIDRCVAVAAAWPS